MNKSSRQRQTTNHMYFKNQYSQKLAFQKRLCKIIFSQMHRLCVCHNEMCVKCEINNNNNHTSILEFNGAAGCRSAIMTRAEIHRKYSVLLWIAVKRWKSNANERLMLTSWDQLQFYRKGSDGLIQDLVLFGEMVFDITAAIEGSSFQVHTT